MLAVHFHGAPSSGGSYSQEFSECQSPRKGLLAYFCSFAHAGTMRPNVGHPDFTPLLS